MNRNCIRIAACALAGTIAFSGYQTLHAQTSMSRMLPAAGIAVVLEEGTSIQELTQEVIQNIAYLESASGLQPNIMIATEKVHNAELIETETVLSSTADLTSIIHNQVEQSAKTISDEMMTSVVTEGVVKEEDTEKKFSLLTGVSDILSSDHRNVKVAESDEEATTEPEKALSEEKEEEVQTSTEKGEVNSEIKSEERQELQEETTVSIEEETQSQTEETITPSNDTAEEEQENSVTDFSDLVIAKVDNYVNVRSMPSEKGEIVGKLYDKSVGDYVEEVDGWYKITSGNCTGYVKADYCVTGEEAQQLAKEVGTTYAIVNTKSLKVRKEANTDSSILGLVPMNEELVVVDELDGWVKIAIEEGDGYVSSDYVDLRTDFVHAESKEEEKERLAEEEKEREEAIAAAKAAEAEKELAQKQEQQKEQNVANESTEEIEVQEEENVADHTEETVEKAQENTQVTENTDTVQIQEQQTPTASSIGQAVINYAEQFIGNPYVYGGSSLTNGTDCSGFVMGVYNNFGVSLPHSSSALRSKGYDVGGLQNAQPGDIVCYSGHVALYVGNGKIVHASTSKTGIIISNANYRDILTVRRIF